MEGPTKWPGERDLRGRVQQPGLEAADVTDSTTPASKPAYPLYHEHMDHGPSWLTNLLRLYDPAQLAAKDAAFIRAEITRYVKEATEVESLSPLTELLRADLVAMLDEWLHRDGRRAYRGYLSSDPWQDKREKVMKRAGRLCEGCRANRATEVHHLHYDDPRGEELLFNLVALCGDCHGKIHEREKKKAS
jgi:5-methylcytosine-specific restriction endonuclease McrA